MPNPGAQPDPNGNLAAIDLGRGDDGIWRIATRYTDGSYVVWNAEGANEELAYIEPGRADPADIGGGRAAVINPDGSLTAYSIANPPPQFQGAPAAGAAGATPAAPAAGAGGPGRYAGAYGGQKTPGRSTDVPFGSTVAPSTWNAASPGRNEGWGTIGANTAGVPYGYGTTGFAQNGQVPDLLKINPADLPHLSNAEVAPGYIPGSGTYNQYRLDSPTNQFGAQYGGLFATMPLQNGGSQVVNTRFGLGGTGDPTTGGEVQTPELYVQGRGSNVAMRGDERWRREHPGGGGMGGGWDQAWQGAVPGYRPGPGVSAPATNMNAAGYGASGWQTPVSGQGGLAGMGGGGDGGMGGGYFGSTVTSNWGQTAETAGKDYIATLFLRSDTPTGVGTPAWSAPQAMWDGLLQEIRAGRIYVTDPMAWQMIREKTNQTPQTIGGAATGGQNVQPGAGGLGDAAANAAAAAAADKAAYWAYQQALLRQGDQRIALEEARDAWTKAYQTSQATGQLNGQDTLAKLKQEFDQEMTRAQLEIAQAGLTGTYQGQQTLAAIQQKFNQAVSEAGLTGLWNGQKTQAAIGQENQTALALLGLQSQMQGPRNWAAYQKTFGATPQGLQDVMGAFQGRYQLPTGQGAQNTAQGGVQSVAGLGGDILSGTYGQDGKSGLATVNPRQASVSNWARMMPSQREMILGNYEQEGWYGPDVEKLIQGAAPKYSGPATASYNFFQS